jgi:hypothetical protein
MKLMIKTTSSKSASLVVDADEITVLQIYEFLKNFYGDSCCINVAPQDHLMSLKNNSGAILKNRNYFKYISHGDDAEIV